MSMFCRYQGIWHVLSRSILIVAIIIVKQEVRGETILFDFENLPTTDNGDGTDASFGHGNFWVYFVESSHTHPRYAAQWVNDFRSVPHKGNGSMRLSSSSGTPFLLGEVYARFSMPVIELNFYASSFKNRREIDFDFVLTALDQDESELASFTITEKGTLEDPLWHNVEFSNIGPISGLRFFGMSNYIYWDDLTVTPVPEPTAMGLVAFGCIVFGAGNHRRNKY